MTRITILSRADCHLCHEMRAVVETVAAGHPLVVEEVDIDGDPGLRELWNTAIPALLIDGVEAFRYRVSERALRARLGRAPRRARFL